ncbi:MAG: hypothetical protein M3P29_11785 [Acidobacteriota bacterium]|nr:hypothetical protein [Acidobacteriota bacterium]
MKRLFLLAAASLCAASLHASADLSITNFLSMKNVRAGTSSTVFYSIHNSGPDKATNVVVTFTVTGATASIPCSGGCAINDIPSGQFGSFSEQLTFPAEAGVVTITATVSSSTPDPNTSDNSQTSTLMISTDPDLYVSLGAPLRLDLGLPFSLSIYLTNFSQSPAHDVIVTVDFRTDAAVRALPDGCTSPMPGRITCRADTLTPTTSAIQPGFGATIVAPPKPLFVATIVAPPTYGAGSIAFTATASERENDFDPTTNTASAVSQLYNTFYVTTSADDGGGSIRQAILDANANCPGSALCAIAFRIDEPSANPWKTINIATPLPALTASNLRIDGGTQTGFFGNTNADGPEVEVSGGGSVDGDGLVISGCGAEVANLAVSGFRRNGISVTRPACATYVTTELHHLFLGTDPTGSDSRPNAQRGLGILVPNGTNFNSAGLPIDIHDNVISGNTLSGIFDLSGRVNIWGNRIGVKAHSDDPLPNGASGIFIGPGGYGSAIGPDVLVHYRAANVIAFNGETGVAIAAGVYDVSVLGNRIWGNALLGIDIGLDGPTLSTKSEFDVLIGVPALTLAHYDPASAKTVIEADIPSNGGILSFYANDASDPSGYGEGQRPIGTTPVGVYTTATHFHFEVDGDLTGQFITATNTRSYYTGFAKPEGIEQGFLTQTSEFSRAIEVR